jgi:hypothetical protein
MSSFYHSIWRSILCLCTCNSVSGMFINDLAMMIYCVSMRYSQNLRYSYISQCVHWIQRNGFKTSDCAHFHKCCKIFLRHNIAVSSLLDFWTVCFTSDLISWGTHVSCIYDKHWLYTGNLSFSFTRSFLWIAKFPIEGILIICKIAIMCPFLYKLQFAKLQWFVRFYKLQFAKLQ